MSAREPREAARRRAAPRHDARPGPVRQPPPAAPEISR